MQGAPDLHALGAAGDVVGVEGVAGVFFTFSGAPWFGAGGRAQLSVRRTRSMPCRSACVPPSRATV